MSGYEDEITVPRCPNCRWIRSSNHPEIYPCWTLRNRANETCAEIHTAKCRVTGPFIGKAKYKKLSDSVVARCETCGMAVVSVKDRLIEIVELYYAGIIDPKTLQADD